MKDRIKAIRKAKNLTQQAFADLLGVRQNTVALYEMGRSGVSDAVIKSICREFNVNEIWLRTGEGTMFSDQSSEIENHLNQLGVGNDNFIKEIIISYMSLSDSDKKAIQRFITALVEKRKAEEKIPLKDRPFESLTIDEKVELYRQQLEEEEKNNKNKKGIS